MVFPEETMLAGALLLVGGYFAAKTADVMREAMKRDEILTEICSSALDLLRQIPPEKYEAATVQYNQIRRLARSLMTHKPTARRTYSYRPELRAK